MNVTVLVSVYNTSKQTKLGPLCLFLIPWENLPPDLALMLPARWPPFGLPLPLLWGDRLFIALPDPDILLISNISIHCTYKKLVLLKMEIIKNKNP
jgi:hypothetical protein